jgi:hypothetical protein
MAAWRAGDHRMARAGSTCVLIVIYWFRRAATVIASSLGEVMRKNGVKIVQDQSFGSARGPASGGLQRDGRRKMINVEARSRL